MPSACRSRSSARSACSSKAPMNSNRRYPLKASKPISESGGVGRDQSGIALFMVIAAITVLAILVTEFTYVAQVNQQMAFDGVNQIKAHYLAKTGLKLSLLRLKAYQHVKEALGQAGGGANQLLPK